MGLMEARMNETDESASSEIVESRPSKDFYYRKYIFDQRQSFRSTYTNLDRVILSVFIWKRFLITCLGGAREGTVTTGGLQLENEKLEIYREETYFKP